MYDVEKTDEGLVDQVLEILSQQGFSCDASLRVLTVAIHFVSGKRAIRDAAQSREGAAAMAIVSWLQTAVPFPGHKVSTPLQAATLRVFFAAGVLPSKRRQQILELAISRVYRAMADIPLSVMLHTHEQICNPALPA